MLSNFQAGDRVRISMKFPVNHYRVPLYIRGSTGIIESAIQRTWTIADVDDFGKNISSLGHYYRVAIPLIQLWPDYKGTRTDCLNIEVFQNWLEKI